MTTLNPDENNAVRSLRSNTTDHVQGDIVFKNENKAVTAVSGYQTHNRAIKQQLCSKKKKKTRHGFRAKLDGKTKSNLCKQTIDK